MAGPEVTFRPLRRVHFPLLAGWLSEAQVARWWNHETSADAVERDFGSSVDGGDATEVFITEAGDNPFGLIQRYPIGAYPEYVDEVSAVCPVPPGALSLDYFIGDPLARGRGLGGAMIARMVTDCWSRYPDAYDVIVPVSTANVASWRALQRAGFTRIAAGEMEPDNPIDSRDHYLYWTGRPPADTREST